MATALSRRWSNCADACRDCGRTDRPHQGRGFCKPCFFARYRKGTLPTAATSRWSIWGDACLSCGRADRPHHARGMCRRCYAAQPCMREVHRVCARRWEESERGQQLRAESTRRWEEAGGLEIRRRNARHSARVARDRDAGIQVGVLSKDYDELVFAVFGRRCVACGAVERIYLDHHQPHCKGYALLHNAVPLCPRCNALKGNKDPEVFYDRWKLVEVLVGLQKVRDMFEASAGRSLKEVA
jgi:hypothetical protein